MADQDRTSYYPGSVSLVANMPSYPQLMTAPRVAVTNQTQDQCNRNCVSAFAGNNDNIWNCMNRVCSKFN